MADERPKALKITVVNCRHLPKKDTFGKVDAFVTVKFEGTEQKTRVISKNYNPDFDEFFVFDVSNQETVGPLEITVYDYDNKTSNDTVGEVRFDSQEMVNMMSNNIGWSDNQTYVLTRLGADIKGHDGKPAEIEVRFNVTEQLTSAWRQPSKSSKALIKDIKSALSEGAVEAHTTAGTQAKLVLEVAVENIRHLPKMDTFGKCDPFVLVHYGQRQFRTQVKKGVFDADFGEVCQFDVGENPELPDEELVFEVWDWDRVGENEFIGKFKFTRAEVAEAMRGGLGHETKGSKDYLDKNGKAVFGKDKIATESEYTLRVAHVNQKILIARDGPVQQKSKSTMQSLFGRTPSQEEPEKKVNFVNPNKDVKALMVRLMHGDHLPKMDTWGSCDAFCVVRHGKREHKTKVVKGTYHPQFDETFQFEVPDLKRPVGDVEITVFDWDMTSGNDKIGSAHFGAGEIAQVMTNPIGFWGDEVTLTVMDESGKPVRGHDKKSCEVTIVVGVAELIYDPKAKKPEDTGLKDDIARITKNPEKAAQDMKDMREKIAKMEQQIAAQRKIAENLLKTEQTALEETRSRLEVKGAVADAIHTLLPPTGEPGAYSDLTIEAEDQSYAGEEAELLLLAGHCNIIWARCTGLRIHVEKAWNGEITKGYDCHVVFLRKKIEIPTGPQDVTDENEDQNNRGQKKEQGHEEHDWDPKTCISIPGSVQGTPMRCSCAHGAFALSKKGMFGLGKAGLCYKCGGALTNGAGGGGAQKKVKFRINGVKPRVVQKVIEYIYSAECERFETEEVLDAILVAKGFGLKFLLVLLYKQGYFPDFGCAMWEAARVIDADLDQKWLEEILTNVHHHFMPEKFDHDGRLALTADGFKIILNCHNLHCEEIEIFQSVMSWGQERFKELQIAAKKELIKNPKSEFKPTFKTAAGPLINLVRFPFIAPEDLNLKVSIHPDLLTAYPTDSRGVPLVLRAVFHQNGQRGEDWGPGGLGWVPRAGSKHYNGEWEWRYCHAALTDGKWPVQEKYASIDFNWATDDEIRAMGLSKIEIFNLDEDGDGQPTLEEIIHTFSVQIPFSKFEEHDKRAQAEQVLRGRKEMGMTDKLGAKAKATLGSKDARKRLAKEALWRAVKKISMSAMIFRAMGEDELSRLRAIVAAGRVRPSAMSGSTKDTDPRLHGHAFVIFASKAQARDVQLHYNGRKFYRAVPGVGPGEVHWEPLNGEVPMKISLVV